MEYEWTKIYLYIVAYNLWKKYASGYKVFVSDKSNKIY